MLYLIIRKELRDNLLNARFVVACLVSIILIVSSVVILSESYKAQVEDYQARIRTQDEFITKYGHMNRWGGMSAPTRGPSPYRPLVTGLDPEVFETSFSSNPIPLFFSPFDLVTIVTIVMSLMAILFSYNSISGEREAGLLKQMLSTSASRSTIILGKFVGGCISLIVPFTIGLLSGLIYASLNSSLQLQSMEPTVFLLLLAASWLYITAFYGLGLLFSARSQTSNVAVLKSLFAWVILVLILPNISPFLAAQLYRIPSKTIIGYQESEIRQERFKLQPLRTNELLKTKYVDIAGVVVDIGHVVGQVPSKIQERSASDPLFKKRYDEFMKDWQEAMGTIDRESGDKIGKIEKDYSNREKYQEKLATIFASVSPFANYVFTASDLADAGIPTDDHHQNELRQWWEAMDNYAQVKIQKEIARNPGYTYEDHVDMSDRPRFQYVPQEITEKIGLILPHLGILIFMNLLFLAIAFMSFLKYDVR